MATKKARTIDTTVVPKAMIVVLRKAVWKLGSLSRLVKLSSPTNVWSGLTSDQLKNPRTTVYRIGKIRRNANRATIGARKP